MAKSSNFESHKENWKAIIPHGKAIGVTTESHKENWKYYNFQVIVVNCNKNLIKRIERVRYKRGEAVRINMSNLIKRIERWNNPTYQFTISLRIS